MTDRFLTLTCIIRKYQIEITRDSWLGEDETAAHSAENVQRLADLIRAGFPGARITWALSWCALTDRTPRYTAIREKVRDPHRDFGDDVTFLPGGYFAIRSLESLADAIKAIVGKQK